MPLSPHQKRPMDFLFCEITFTAIKVVELTPKQVWHWIVNPATLVTVGSNPTNSIDLESY